MRQDAELDAELAAALNAEFGVKRVWSMPIAPDGTERRGAVHDLAEMVRNVLVFLGEDMDAEEAQAIVKWIRVWSRARRKRVGEDDIRFVSIYGPDGHSILLRVPVRAD